MAKNPFPASAANNKFPYDPFSGRGDPDDSVAYIQPPDKEFIRPWLMVPNGPVFVFPVGLQGWDITIDPALGIHKYIGDNKVEVSVLHLGEETFTLTGILPGLSSTDALQQLRQVVYAVQPTSGKILSLPGLLPYAQRVACGRTSFVHDQDDRGSDASYTIEFKRLGLAQKLPNYVTLKPVLQPTRPAKGGSSRVYVATGRYNTIRQIAQLKLGNANKWESIYNKNLKLFNRLKIPKHKAPIYHLKVGTKVYW